MANGRRPVATARKLIAAVLGTVAMFVMLFGLGMTSWAIVALGVALLVLAISLVMVSALRGGTRAWVAGTAYVRSVSEPPAASAYGRCEMQILIDAPGLPARSLKVRDPRVPVAKWPDPGATLPIMVAIDDPRHVRILWDDVLTHAEAATATEPGPDQFADDPLDDLLIDDEPPPWARRDPDDDLPRPDEALTTDLSDDLGGLRDEPAARDDEPVVVRQTPGGPLVLEGTLVDPPSPDVPLPRRARPSTRPQDEHGAAPDGDAPTRPEGALLTEATPAGADASPVDWSATTTDPAWPAEPRPVGLHDPVEEEALLSGMTDAAGAGGQPTRGVGVTVLVADLDRSMAFYRDLLDFHEIDGGEGNAVLTYGRTRVVLRAIRDVAPINRRVVHLNLEVNDVDAKYDELKAKGVRFTYAPRVVNRGEKLELWAAAFRDPDGHGIAVTQWRERRAG